MPAKTKKENEDEELSKVEIEKLNNQRVDRLKGKLVEVRRAGAHPVFVEITSTDTISKCLEKADVPTEDDEIKVEAMEEGKAKWASVKLTDKAMKYKKVIVTTMVRGSI
jgi:hypothetical protein